MTGPVGPEVPAPGRRRRPPDGPPDGRRWLVLLAVVGVLVGAGLYGTGAVAPPPPSPGPSAVTTAAATAASSSWYCTGGSSAPENLATATIYLTDTAARPVAGTATVVSDAGTTATVPVSVPARSEVALSPSGAVSTGYWLAARIDLNGGGVVATQAVAGPSGWAEAPCAAVTSPTWYFASGATGGGHDLFVSLYNPTTTSAVVDLAFVTPGGVQQPAPFEGIIVPPGQVVVAGVGAYVQRQGTVSTSVVARTGQVVADVLETDSGSLQGMSLRLGSPAPVAAWSLPRTVDVTGGSDVLDVFNPTGGAQRVTVSFDLGSGAPAPLVHRVAADSTWTLALSATSRLPGNDDYATTVRAAGPGVVVDRVLAAPPVANPPQWGAAPAVPAPQWAAASPGALGAGAVRAWVLPGPGDASGAAEPGAAPFAVGVEAEGARPLRVTLGVLTATGYRSLPGTSTTLAPGHFAIFEPGALAAAGLSPLVVSATGTVAVMEELVPAGAPGVVTLPGMPLG